MLKKHLKTYEQYDFDDLSEEDIFGKDDEINIGDQVRLFCNINARLGFFEIDSNNFRNSSIDPFETFTVRGIHININGVKLLNLLNKDMPSCWYRADMCKKVS